MLVTRLKCLFVDSVLEVISALQTEGASLKTVFGNLDSMGPPSCLFYSMNNHNPPTELAARITRTYVDQSSFWLKWFPCVIY